jgi:hypothetical protein
MPDIFPASKALPEFDDAVGTSVDAADDADEALDLATEAVPVLVIRGPVCNTVLNALDDCEVTIIVPLATPEFDDNDDDVSFPAP